MDLLWPGFLLLLGLIPLIVGFYLWRLHRRQRFTIRYSSLSLVREALPRQPRWRRQQRDPAPDAGGSSGAHL